MGIFRRAFRGLRRLFRRKKRAVTKKRAYRKRRAPRPTNVLTIKKTVLGTGEDVMANNLTFHALDFKLANVPQYANYVATYEEFRINKIVVSFRSLNNTVPANFTAGNTCTAGMIHSIIDYNDSNTPTSLQGMMNDPSYRGTRSTREKHTRVIYPRFLNTVSVSNTSSGALQEKRGWMLCESSATPPVLNDVPHFGIKYCYEGGINSGGNYPTFVSLPIFTYYVSFRNPK